MAETIRLAYVGVGNGRAIIANALAEHGPAAGINIQLIDLFPYIGRIEGMAVEHAYTNISASPRLFRPIRRIYETTGPVTLDRKNLKELFPKDEPVITDTSVAAQILGNLGIRICHIVADRRIQWGDVGKGIEFIGTPGNDILDFDRSLKKKVRVVNMIGIPQPIGYLEVNPLERRRELVFDATPTVLFTVNGAGDLGRIRPVVEQLAPLVKENMIQLSIFTGQHPDALEKAKQAAQSADLTLYETDRPEKPANQKRIIYAYFAQNRIEAVILRNKIVPGAHILIPAATGESTNSPAVVIFDPSSPRNDNEASNAKYAREKGWAISGGDKFSYLGTTTRTILTSVKGVSLAQTMYDAALQYNPPRSATIFLNEVKNY